MKIRPSSYFLIAILLGVLAVILWSATFRYIETKLLPLIIGGLVFILAAIELKRELSSKREPSKAMEQQGKAVVEKDVFRKHVSVAAWIGGFFLAIYSLGFAIAIPLFVFSYLKSHGRGWVIAISLAAIMALFAYGVFERLLGIQLYRGLIFT